MPQGELFHFDDAPADPTKLCWRCQTRKPLDQFGIERGRKDGRHAKCRICAREMAAQQAEQYKARFKSRPTTGTRRCIFCRTVKPVAEFNTDRRTKSGLSAWCRPCGIRRARERQKTLRVNGTLHAEQRRYNINRKGVREEEYLRMLDAQGGVCAICGKPESVRYQGKRGTGRTKALYIDHCHQSFKIRGLLCHSCNCGIGHFYDDPALLEAAIAYLRKHQE